MESPIFNLLQKSTVRISVENKSWGTGFFVSPNLIITCAHVVKKSINNRVTFFEKNSKKCNEAEIEHLDQNCDLALLRTKSYIKNRSYVFLNVDVKTDDILYSYGYPDDFKQGAPVTFKCEGLTGDNPPFLKFKSGQARPGLSGAPLLNKRTGKVCGIVKFTRDRNLDLGGGAIPTTVIFQKFPKIKSKNKKLHNQNKIWLNLIPSFVRYQKINQEFNNILSELQELKIVFSDQALIEARKGINFLSTYCLSNQKTIRENALNQSYIEFKKLTEISQATLVLDKPDNPTLEIVRNISSDIYEPVSKPILNVFHNVLAYIDPLAKNNNPNNDTLSLTEIEGLICIGNWGIFHYFRFLNDERNANFYMYDCMQKYPIIGLSLFFKYLPLPSQKKASKILENNKKLINLLERYRDIWWHTSMLSETAYVAIKAGYVVSLGLQIFGKGSIRNYANIMREKLYHTSSPSPKNLEIKKLKQDIEKISTELEISCQKIQEECEYEKQKLAWEY